MSRSRFGLCALMVFGMATAHGGSPARAASLDGDWRVNIVTRSGNCDPAYSYPVKLSGGRISYAGSGDFQINGTVSEAGAVRVEISRGEQRASGTGKLSGSNGAGEWSGKSATDACSGRWEATRN